MCSKLLAGICLVGVAPVWLSACASSSRNALPPEDAATKRDDSKSVNPELLRLYQEDQADRSQGFSAKVDWAGVIARDAKRRERVHQILDAGGAKVSADYFFAAMVFQHGNDVVDYQLAHKLALKATQLDETNKSARWLSAAAKDRELMKLGRPQLYGTQFRIENGRWVLYQVDPSVTDEERAKWNVPPLGQAKKRAETMNAGKN